MKKKFIAMLSRYFPLLIEWNFENMLSSLAKRMQLHESHFIWKEEQFGSSVFKPISCTGCFTAYMGAHFPVEELDIVNWFGNVLTFRRCMGFYGCPLFSSHPSTELNWIQLNWISLFIISYVIIKLHNSSHLLNVSK